MQRYLLSLMIPTQEQCGFQLQVGICKRQQYLDSPDFVLKAFCHENPNFESNVFSGMEATAYFAALTFRVHHSLVSWEQRVQ